MLKLIFMIINIGYINNIQSEKVNTDDFHIFVFINQDLEPKVLMCKLFMESMKDPNSKAVQDCIKSLSKEDDLRLSVDECIFKKKKKINKEIKEEINQKMQRLFNKWKKEKKAIPIEFSTASLYERLIFIKHALMYYNSIKTTKKDNNSVKITEEDIFFSQKCYEIFTENLDILKGFVGIKTSKKVDINNLLQKIDKI